MSSETGQPESDVTLFARTNFRNSLKPFGIKTDDRRRHMYVVGKTGMGKSTLLENMVIQDIRNGRGMAVVDPHGDLVEKVLKYIPSYRVNDVIYFNPSDADYPIAFNILESINPAHRHLIASGLIAVFKKIWVDSWGPRLEYILRNTILGLIEYPGSTLLGVNRMLVDKDYRAKVVSHIDDPVVKAFWQTEFAGFNNQFRTEAISPIQNKIGQFLSSSIIRNIVGQSKSTIDMRQIMDDGKILLLNLAKGRVGEDNAALLGAMMITKLQLAAMSRIDIPEPERRDFFLYVDEFQNFATESFAGILSEARKYRLNLIIAHQYIEQLDEKVRPAVFGNVGTMITFRVGAADAEFLAKEYEPVFTETDLVNLTKYDIYLKLMIDGVASEPFSATGLPPVQNPDNLEDTIIRVSRERYANTRADVEEKISRWSGATEEAGRKEQAEMQAAKEKAANPLADAIILDREPVAAPEAPAAISLSEAIKVEPRHDNPRREPRRDNRPRQPERQGQPARNRDQRQPQNNNNRSGNRPRQAHNQPGYQRPVTAPTEPKPQPVASLPTPAPVVVPPPQPPQPTPPSATTESRPQTLQPGQVIRLS